MFACTCTNHVYTKNKINKYYLCKTMFICACTNHVYTKNKINKYYLCKTMFVCACTNHVYTQTSNSVKISLGKTVAFTRIFRPTIWKIWAKSGI